jgi:hypothetical protein
MLRNLIGFICVLMLDQAYAIDQHILGPATYQNLPQNELMELANDPTFQQEMMLRANFIQLDQQYQSCQQAKMPVIPFSYTLNNSETKMILQGECVYFKRKEMDYLSYMVCYNPKSAECVRKLNGILPSIIDYNQRVLQGQPAKQSTINL